jgi:hypothetical protein
MFYFNSFPLVQTTDYNGNLVTLTNILERVEIIPTLLDNVSMFYNYDIKDTDTPDIIADKYYGDSYRYWLVPYANQMVDVQGEWPMTENLLNDYIIDKYTQDTANTLNIAVANVTSSQVFAYTQSTIQNYVMTIKTFDSTTSNTTITNYNIDSYAYANISLLSEENNGQPVYFPDGSYVTKTITGSTQSIYEYEVELNESKRNINLINATYAGAMEKQLTTLLNT